MKLLSSNTIKINLAFLFISTSGVLGRYIDLPVPTIIALRSVIAGIILYAFCKWRGIDLKILRKDRRIILIGGLLLGVHWITYFVALKLSNVAIGMLSLYTFPAITAILEPIISKSKLLKSHLVLGALVLIGVYFLVPEFDVDNSHFIAVGFGVLSALCYAIRNILMRMKVKEYNGSVLMMYQLFIISIILSPLFFVLDHTGMLEYLPYTLLLAVLTTAIGHTLFIHSLKHFSAVSASIMSSLQPVYGIILGIIFLGELPLVTTIFGGLIILSTVIIENIRIRKAS
jgi:drug/metabolite transporter (DMT)-like permease